MNIKAIVAAVVGDDNLSDAQTVEKERDFKTRLLEAEDNYRQVLEVLPHSRERSMVLTKLDEARLWALDLARQSDF